MIMQKEIEMLKVVAKLDLNDNDIEKQKAF